MGKDRRNRNHGSDEKFDPCDIPREREAPQKIPDDWKGSHWVVCPQEYGTWRPTANNQVWRKLHLEKKSAHIFWARDPTDHQTDVHEMLGRKEREFKIDTLDRNGQKVRVFKHCSLTFEQESTGSPVPKPPSKTGGKPINKPEGDWLLSILWLWVFV